MKLPDISNPQRPPPRTLEEFEAALNALRDEMSGEAVPIDPVSGLASDRWYAETAARVHALLDSVADMRVPVAVGVTFDRTTSGASLAFKHSQTGEAITTSARLFELCGGRVLH